VVIQFTHPKPRAYLLKHGHVYTYRTRKRKQTGKDWTCAKRGGTKIADVHITLEREIEAPLFGALKKYAKESGFGYVADWVTAIMNLNPRISFAKGYLYHVELIRDE